MRLLILRHGKAEPHSTSGRDTDRSLTDRGIRQAAWIGQSLLQGRGEACGRLPERILSSPARRAQQTASGVAEFLGMHVEGARELDVDEPLSGLLDVLHLLLRQGISCAMFVGHNPQLEAFVNHLRVCAGATATQRIDLRTGEMYAFDVDLDERALLAGGIDWPTELVGSARLEEQDEG